MSDAETAAKTDKAAGDDQALYGALEKKIAGAVRSAISNCSNLAQSVVAKAMAEPTFAEESRKKQQTLEGRARKVKEVLAAADRLGDALRAVSAAAAGQPFEHLLADLIEREPELPEHLRTATVEPEND